MSQRIEKMRVSTSPKRIGQVVAATLVFLLLFHLLPTMVRAETEIPLPNVEISIGTAETPQEVNRTLQILFFMTLISLAPYFLVVVTSFTRFIIAFHFLRAALGTQQMPPNQVLVGLSLILTLFTMGPTMTAINENALQPYNEGRLTQQEAVQEAIKPVREFMLKQVEVKDLDLFGELAGLEPYDNYEQMSEELPNSVLLPAFILGEITKGFKIGVILYIPFIVIDMVVASTLMAMGMMMLPPAMISLPFKILFFVMIDGWEVVIQGVIKTFNG